MKNRGMGAIVLRVASYTILALLAVYLLGVQLNIAEAVNIVGICLLGFIVEAALDKHVAGPRKIAYIACVTVMCLSSLVMTRQVAMLHAASASTRTTAASPMPQPPPTDKP